MSRLLAGLLARAVADAESPRRCEGVRGSDLRCCLNQQRAPEGIRTPNLLIRSQMLYPLSYGRGHRAVSPRGRQ